MFNRPFMLLICALIAACPVDAQQLQVYDNNSWGFSVKMPQTIRYEMDRPPNPNHGFRIAISNDSFVWVNGESTDDPSLKDVADSEIALWQRQNCMIDAYMPTLLAHRPAMEIELHCHAGIDKKVSKRIHLLVAFASPSHIGNVAYTIGVASLDDEQSYKVAKSTFEIVRNGFQFHK